MVDGNEEERFEDWGTPGDQEKSSWIRPEKLDAQTGLDAVWRSDETYANLVATSEDRHVDGEVRLHRERSLIGSPFLSKLGGLAQSAKGRLPQPVLGQTTGSMLSGVIGLIALLGVGGTWLYTDSAQVESVAGELSAVEPSTSAPVASLPGASQGDQPEPSSPSRRGSGVEGVTSDPALSGAVDESTVDSAGENGAAQPVSDPGSRVETVAVPWSGLSRPATPAPVRPVVSPVSSPAPSPEEQPDPGMGGAIPGLGCPARPPGGIRPPPLLAGPVKPSSESADSQRHGGPCHGPGRGPEGNWLPLPGVPKPSKSPGEKRKPRVSVLDRVAPRPVRPPRPEVRTLLQAPADPAEVSPPGDLAGPEAVPRDSTPAVADLPPRGEDAEPSLPVQPPAGGDAADVETAPAILPAGESEDQDDDEELPEPAPEPDEAPPAPEGG